MNFIRDTYDSLLYLFDTNSRTVDVTKGALSHEMNRYRTTLAFGTYSLSTVGSLYKALSEKLFFVKKVPYIEKFKIQENVPVA